jgi:D-serine dehydratase
MAVKVFLDVKLSEQIIDSSYKGLPEKAQGQSFKSFLESKPNLFTSEFRFPIATLRKSALDHNLTRMAAYCREIGASLAPHLKTTMSPQIAKMQMDHGAWALTLANFAQAKIFLDFGFKRIIVANEIVDKGTIREIATINLDDQAEVIFYVDSLAGLAAISEALEGLTRAKILLLIEIGVQGGRGGIRNNQDAVILAKEIAKDSRLSLLGVSGFEGVVPGGGRSDEGLLKVAAFCQKIVEAAELVEPFINQEKIILTAGGSSYFDVVSQEFVKFSKPFHMVLRSGGYVTHDHGAYFNNYPFLGLPATQQLLPTIELWAQVLTCPEPGVAILNLGKRDVGIDVDNPFPLKRFHSELLPIKGRIDHLNDQHGYLYFLPDQQIQVGDLVSLGISHPCTTFDKWRLLALVDDNYEVVDLIHTFF